MKTVLYLILALLIVSSCDSEEPSLENINSFLGTWELKSFIYQGDIAIFIPSKVTINFNDETKGLAFNGNSACNLYGGSVSKVTKKNISFSGIFSTNMACLGETGSFESTYFDVLSKIDQYSFENDNLVLFFSNNYITFEKE